MPHPLVPRRIARWATVLWTAILLAASPVAAQVFTVEALVDGFRRTVFGSEFGTFSFTSPYLRRFEGAVRVHLDVTSAVPGAGDRVRAFLRRLDREVVRLDIRLVGDPEEANFRVFVVDRADYAATVKEKVYDSAFATVRGRCMVRALFTRSGITRADAVIVADEGDELFGRCMAEELMQGLGPLNDDATLDASMFNDATPFTVPQRFDLLILNMLYDRRLKSGMTAAEAEPTLRAIARTALANLPPEGHFRVR